MTGTEKEKQTEKNRKETLDRGGRKKIMTREWR